MLGLLREGFWRDALALVVVAVVVGGLAAGGVARGVEAYFTQAVTGLVGAPGEYDAIVHLKQEAGAEGLGAVFSRLAERYPGHTHKVGPELAGYFNVLIRLPDQRRTRAGFESLRAALEDVPGFDGITYIVEPAIVINDIHPALQQDFIDHAQGHEGVAFSFGSGSSVWAVLHSADDAKDVQRELEGFVASQAILDLRLPVAASAEARDTLAWDTIVKLEEALPSLRVSLLESEPIDGGPAADLLAARRLITELNEVDTARLRTRLFEAADMIEGAFVDGIQSGDADFAYVLDAFGQSIDQLELLEARLVDLADQLRGAAQQGEASDVLVALLIQRLVDRLGGGGEIQAPESAVDVAELRAGIDAIAERLRSLEQLDPGQIAASLRELGAALPRVEPSATERIVAVIDALVDQGAGAGDRVLIVARGVEDRSELRRLGADAVGDSAQVYVQSAGVVQPDARTAVLQLLVGARRVVTLLVALLLFVVVCLFDVMALLGYVRRTAEVDGKSWARAAFEPLAWGGLFGAVVLTAMVWLATGGEALGGAALPIAGWILGSLLALASERVAPVDRNQFLSALSLGIAGPDVLREVIIPAGRPGLLYWLTRSGRKLGRGSLERGTAPCFNLTE